MNQKTLATAMKAALFFSIALLPVFAQEQATDLDTQKAALETKAKALSIQQKIDKLLLQKQALEALEKSRPTPTTTDAEMAATQAQLKILDLAKQIADLKNQQAVLLNPPPVSELPLRLPSATPPSPPPAPPSANVQPPKTTDCTPSQGRRSR